MNNISQKSKTKTSIGNLVKRAIRHLGESKGSSFVDIRKYLLSLQKDGRYMPNLMSIKQYLKNAVDKGIILKLGNGKYKMNKNASKKSNSRRLSRNKSISKPKPKKNSSTKQCSRSRRKSCRRPRNEKRATRIKKRKQATRTKKRAAIPKKVVKRRRKADAITPRTSKILVNRETKKKTPLKSIKKKQGTRIRKQAATPKKVVKRRKKANAITPRTSKTVVNRQTKKKHPIPLQLIKKKQDTRAKKRAATPKQVVKRRKLDAVIPHTSKMVVKRHTKKKCPLRPSQLIKKKQTTHSKKRAEASKKVVKRRKVEDITPHIPNMIDNQDIKKKSPVTPSESVNKKKNEKGAETSKKVDKRRKVDAAEYLKAYRDESDYVNPDVIKITYFV